MHFLRTPSLGLRGISKVKMVTQAVTPLSCGTFQLIHLMPRPEWVSNGQPHSFNLLNGFHPRPPLLIVFF